jgi:hypothetical protein
MPPARMDDPEEIRAAVGARYADLARAAQAGQTVAEDRLTRAQRSERGGQVGCAGVASFAEYRTGLATAGFTAIAMTSTHEVADGVHSAIIRAARP